MSNRLGECIGTGGPAANPSISIGNRSMEQPGPLEMLIVGSHPLVAEGIRSLVSQMDICGSLLYAPNVVTATRLLRENDIDLVILDLADDAKDEILTSIREYDEDVPIIVLSVCESTTAARSTVLAGLTENRLNTTQLDFLKQSIGVAIRDRHVAFVPMGPFAPSGVHRDERGAVPEAKPRVSLERQHRLTNQETKVLAQIAEGMTNKEIARALGILEGTVKVHVKSILRKLDAKNRTVAALMAVGISAR